MGQQVSQYEKYWLKLLDEGTLTIQVPTSLVASIKKAIIKRKYNHRLRSGIIFNPLKIISSPATDASGKELPAKTRLQFKLHNLREKDI